MDSKQFKQDILEKLYAPYKNCTMCPLGSLGRTNVVFGEGNPNATLMLIGEGPGKDEDAQNRPFVGRSGQLLTRALTHCGVDRSTIFITNIVKCRPPENRAPTPLESTTCRNLLLLKQIKIIRPSVICTLGSTALRYLLDQEIKITQMRGKLIHKDTFIVIPTYHPAYILRNPPALSTFIGDIALAVEHAKTKK